MYNTCAGTSNFLIIYILTNKSTLTCTVLASVGPLHRPQTDADTRNLAQPATTN